MSEVKLTARSLEVLLGDWRGAGDDAGYAALADRVRLLVLDGRMGVGSRLPAERELAERIGVSRTTVTAAYRRLREAGYLVSTRGSGSVARLPGASAIGAPEAAPELLDFTKAAMPAVPGLADVAAAALDRLPAHLAGIGFDPLGVPELREAIAERYSARGLPTSADQIMVTLGAQHAIALLSRTLLSRGDRAVIQLPSYPHAFEALRAAGARLVGVPVVPEGVPISADDELVEAVRYSNPALAYLMPDFHNPTGRSMTDAERAAVTAAAARQGTVVVADETTAEMDIDRPHSTLPLAAHGPAVTVGSLSKTVWGGLRIGWIRADATLIRTLADRRAPNDLGTPVLEQLIATELMPRMDGVLAVRREQLRAARDHLETRLAETFPTWRVPHVHGGLATWVNLGDPVSSQLALGARAQGLVIAAGPRFGIDGAFERFLRVPFGYSDELTDRGVDALRRAWGALSGAPAAGIGYLADVV